MSMAALTCKFRLISLLPRLAILPSNANVRCASKFLPFSFKMPTLRGSRDTGSSHAEKLKAVAKTKEAADAEIEGKEEEDEDDIKQPTVRIRKLNNKYKDNPAPLMEFFDDYSNWGEESVKTGREWRVDDLRLKSNDDIHKLWFILYKERNMLLTMLEESRDQVELFPSPERLDKVEQSMLNIEEVVKERNKAYYELEVGNNETGMRPVAFRRDLFGIHRLMSCSQHLIPYRMNKKFRQFEGPGFGKIVDSFINKYREKQTRKQSRRVLEQWLYVRQVLRRFPNVNIDELKALYPKVPVDYLKENLDYFEERKDVWLFGRHGHWPRKH